jgi:hypothetical protein
MAYMSLSFCLIATSHAIAQSPAMPPIAPPLPPRWTDVLLEATAPTRMQGGRGARRNFSGQNLTGLKAPGREMIHFDFRNAKLLGADLRRADLRGADFRGADLTNAILTSAKLTSAKFDRHTSLPIFRDAALRLGMIEVESEEPSPQIPPAPPAPPSASNEADREVD